jgi:hypothetical protein
MFQLGPGDTPQPCPPASPHGVVGGPSQQMVMLLNSPPLRTPSRTAPTWANVTTGDDRVQRENPSPQLASPADAISLYRRCASMGLQAHFSIKSNT